MKALDLSTQSIVQLAKLEAEQQQNIKNITRILAKVDEMCQEEADMSLDQLIDCYDYCIERLDALSKEKKFRLDNAVDKMIEESEDVKKLQSYPGYLTNLK
jgi:flagellin-specific chaperone FliS